MKTSFLAVLGLMAFLFVFLVEPKAMAVGSGAVPVRRVYGPSPVMTWQYAELIPSTVKGVSGVQINNTGLHPIMLAFGAAGSEVAQLIVGGNEDTAFIPVSGGYATRLSVISLDGPQEVGELNVNVVYN